MGHSSPVGSGTFGRSEREVRRYNPHMNGLPWAPSPELDFDLAESPAERFAAVPEAVLLRGRVLLAEVLAFVPPAAMKLASVIRERTKNRFQAETEAWAARLGIGWRELLLANVSYDLALAYWGCSTAALATPEGPRLVRNMDWMPEVPLARATCAMRYAHAGEPRFAAAGFPGAVGVVTGVSARGFALVLNAVGAPGGPDMTGWPVLLFLRRVLEEAEHFDEALAWLTEQRLTVGALITLAGRENAQRVVVERAPNAATLRWARGDEPLVTTNHYRALEAESGALAGGLERTTCGRWERLAELAGGWREREPGDAEVLRALQDPGVQQEITAQHVLMDPARGGLRVFVPRRLLPAG